MRTTTLLLASSLLCAPAFSQDTFRCGHDELHRMGGSIPGLAERAAESTAELEAFTRSFINDHDPNARDGAYVIPVVFHIIHDNGPENISDEQVHDAMRILNDDFNKRNEDWDDVRPEFLSRVADVGIEFRLATRDPNGHCTSGITRTRSALTNQGDSQMKQLISWPRNKYMQVWVAAYADGAAGYTFRPGVAAWNAAEDGIVVEHRYLGANPGGTGNAYRSRTLTHEVGHWLNLAHTWGSTNEPGLDSNCNMDDEVGDTPNTRGWTACTLNGASCGSTLDNVENYMDYSYCSKMFTNGQKARMIAALNSGTAQRNQLWLAGNLANTGVNRMCQTSFTASRHEVCAGSTIQFTDRTYHNVMARSWSFPGGEPSTSTEANPLVTYPTGGTYTVTLTVTDGSTSLSSTQDVKVFPTGRTAPFSEGFEGASELADIDWVANDHSGNGGFEITDAAGFSGTHSARLLNGAAMRTHMDELISPPIDLSNATSVSVSFRYAYARREGSEMDQLKVYMSNNCGATWTLRTQIFASGSLATADARTTPFVPNGPDEWNQREITTVTSGFLVPNVLLKFEFLSDGGNHLYLDDININGVPVGLAEAAPVAGPMLAVMPNPATEATEAVFRAAAGRAVLDLVDITGRVVKELPVGRSTIGEQRVRIPTADLPSGIYFVRLGQDGVRETVRLVVP